MKFGMGHSYWGTTWKCDLEKYKKVAEKLSRYGFDMFVDFSKVQPVILTILFHIFYILCTISYQMSRLKGANSSFAWLMPLSRA